MAAPYTGHRPQKNQFLIRKRKFKENEKNGIFFEK